ncbi:MAG: antitermination protein NusG [Acidimicrobiia bacterium]
MTLFDSANTFAQFWRFLHIVVGITWIGLLYYFNFVQVPAFAAFKEASARNEAIDKLARKALWWFRWAALATFVTGLLIALTTEDYFKNDFGKRMDGLSISTGMLLGTIMLLNVWGVIWRNQKIVLANAANVLAGGQADPNAAAAGRKALMASRQNTMFSVSMIWFMTITSHLAPAFNDGNLATSGKMGAYWLIALAVIGVLELSALGIIGGTAAGNITNWFYESVQNVLIGAFGLWAFFWLLWEILF